MISQAEKITKHNTGMKFNVALNYSGKEDILSYIKKISHQAKSTKLCPNNLGYDDMKKI